MIRFVCSVNIMFILLGVLSLLFGGQILYVEIVQEMHRATNVVLIGVILVTYGLHAIQAGINTLFVEEV